MKVNIPEELKSDLPPNKWGKILTATPVIMTVVATALAGLASSEMTRAQYDRSLAAQQQSKAGDQWGYFQAKRLRSALQRDTLDLLRSTTEIRPLDAATLEKSAGPITLEAVAALQKGELPKVTATPLDPRVSAALDALQSSKAESEITALLAPVDNQTLAQALQSAKDDASNFDAATRPINRVIDRVEKGLSQANQQLSRDFVAARLNCTALRYDAESRLNQTVAYLYELQVRKNNISAERHHTRSQRFFYGMLAAQMGVIIATFAIAARKRSLLWGLAAAAGTGAVSFALYVYLYV